MPLLGMLHHKLYLLSSTRKDFRGNNLKKEEADPHEYSPFHLSLSRVHVLLKGTLFFYTHVLF